MTSLPVASLRPAPLPLSALSLSLSVLNGVCSHDQYKQRFTVVQPRSRDILSVLDIAKVADILLLVIVAPEGVDDFGFLSISSIRAQGPPSAVAVVQVCVCMKCT